MNAIVNPRYDNQSFSFSLKSSSDIETETFFLPHLGKCNLKMSFKSLYYRNCTSHKLFDLSFSIRFNESPIDKVSFLKLKAQIGNLTEQEDFGYEFTLNRDKINRNEFISRSQVVSESNSRTAPYNWSITIYLPQFNNFIKNLHFTQLLSDTTYSDLKLIVGNQVFNVHKCILAVQSKIFSNMIKTDMLEKMTSVIKLPEFDPIVVKEGLNYIYTYECNVSLNPHELFKLAHYLEIKELMDLCTNYLLNNINIKNIIHTLELAEISQYELSGLLEVANKFIENNKVLLSRDPDFIEYLYNTMNIENISFVLKFSYDYQLENLLQKAIKLIITSDGMVVNDEFKSLLLSNPELMYKFLLTTIN